VEEKIRIESEDIKMNESLNNVSENSSSSSINYKTKSVKSKGIVKRQSSIILMEGSPISKEKKRMRLSKQLSKRKLSMAVGLESEKLDKKVFQVVKCEEKQLDKLEEFEEYD
jgi:TolB-like protein